MIKPIYYNVTPTHVSPKDDSYKSAIRRVRNVSHVMFVPLSLCNQNTCSSHDQHIHVKKKFNAKRH